MVAQGLLDDLRKARRRLERGGDADALHDFRVALRRLRSWLRAYRPSLRDTVRGPTLRALRTVADLTNGARDTEVALAWLATREELPSRAQPGIRHLAARLRREHRRFARELGVHIGEDLTKVLRRLDGQLSHFRIDVTSRSPETLEPMAGAVAARLREHSERFEAAVRPVLAEDDEEAAHAARIAGKRLRYLLEPLDDDPRAAAVVKQLARIQDALGALHDAAVLRRRIARERASLAKLSRTRPAPRPTGRSLPGDPRPGLYALAGRASADGEAAFATFRREWIANGDAILVTTAQIAEDLGKR